MKHGVVRFSATADYAVRATAQLAVASDDGAVSAVRLADEQEIPLRFLHGVLAELRGALLVRSTRGQDGGFLSRPAEEITLADVLRAVDGSLIDVHDERLTELSYPGAATALTEVGWRPAPACARVRACHGGRPGIRAAAGRRHRSLGALPGLSTTLSVQGGRPQNAPRPRITAPTVFHRMIRSRASDQFST